MMSPFSLKLRIPGYRTQVLLLAIFSIGLGVFAQPTDTESNFNAPKHVSNAAKLCQAGLLSEALDEINRAIETENGYNDAYTMFVSGFIYKEIYKQSESGIRNSAAREQAVAAFVRARTLGNEGQKVQSTAAPLQFLANTYYNDALMSAMGFTADNEFESEELFQKYLRISKELNPEEDLTLRKAEHSRTTGMRYLMLWLEDKTNTRWHERAVQRMSTTLELDPNDCTTMYNLAVAHYEWADVRPDSAGTSIGLAANQLHRGEKICPDSPEIIKGLLNVYKLKNEPAMVTFYEQRLAEFSQRNSKVKN